MLHAQDASSQQGEEHEQDLGQSRKSFVVEPETSESEGTASIAHSDDRAEDQQDTNTDGREVTKAASFHSVDQDVADLQSDMQNVTIEEPAEDTGDAAADARSHVSDISNSSQHSPRHGAHVNEHAAAEMDVATE